MDPIIPIRISVIPTLTLSYYVVAPYIAEVFRQFKGGQRENLQQGLSGYSTHIYLKNGIYDCTLKVGYTENSYETFKCHKGILSMTSCVFKAMFFGHFKEATMGPDEPITIKGFSAKAFDTVLRLIYGIKQEPMDVPFAAEVYLVADFLQVTCVMDEIEAKILQKIRPQNLFAAYDCFYWTNNKRGVQKCREMLFKEPEKAFSSVHWLMVSEVTIKDLMGSEVLPVSENLLFRALIAWGEAQVATASSNPSTTPLRSKIDSALKLIRFQNIKSEDFANICLQLPPNTLTEKEKCSILISQTLKSPCYLPPEFSQGLARNTSNLVTIKDPHKSRLDIPLLAQMLWHQK